MAGRMGGGESTSHLRILPGWVSRDDTGTDALVCNSRETGGGIRLTARVLLRTKVTGGDGGEESRCSDRAH